jgi:hypothetical protein
LVRIVALAVLAIGGLSTAAPGCASGGDKMVEGDEQQKGSLCARRCDHEAEAGCTVGARCESDCQALIRENPVCVDDADDLNLCIIDRVVTCDADGDPELPQACEDEFTAFEACVDEASALEPSPEPSAADDDVPVAEPPAGGDDEITDEELQCAEQCLTDHEDGYIWYLAGGALCVCDLQLCDDSCLAFCTTDDPGDDACFACIDEQSTVGTECADVQVELCTAEPLCVAWMECVQACF